MRGERYTTVQVGEIQGCGIKDRKEKLHCESVDDGASFLINQFDVVDRKSPSGVFFFVFT